MISDEGFLKEMKENRGVDLINKTYNAIAECGGLDPSFFWIIN